MDLQNIGEFHCDVCFEVFGENFKSPRMLTCGHSFCHSCLENLIAQSPSCPNCKRVIQFANVDSIPVNYTVKSFVSRLNVADPASLVEQNNLLTAGQSSELNEELLDSSPLKKDSSSKELPKEGFCDDHFIHKHFRCMDCKCWACGNCIALNHKPCRTLLVAEALKEMKQEISKEVEAEIKEKNLQNKHLDIYLNDLERKMLSLKTEIKKIQLDLRNKIENLKSIGKTIEQLQHLKSERKKYCEKVKTMETNVITTSNDDQFTKATSKLNDFLDQSRRLLEELTIPRRCYGHFTIEILRDWCQEGSVYASRSQDGKNQYGQVKVIGSRVWVHCFQPKRPHLQNMMLISFRELLVLFSGSLDLPQRGFIQVENAPLGLKDVVIATDSLTPRAKNFLLLCSGIKGRSYEGIKLNCGGWWIGTPLQLGGAVVEGITDGGVYEAPMKKGSVYGFWVENTVWLSGFLILMKDDPSDKLLTKFGFVEEGLDFLEGIKKGSRVLIKHCGLVI